MKLFPMLTVTLTLSALLSPMVGCEGESPTAAIPKTEDRLSSYALTQIYMVPITSGMGYDADSFKSQIDSVIAEYGEEAVVEKIKEIATTHEDPAYRVAAVFSIRPYVSGDEFDALADTLDADSRAELDAMVR